MPVLIDTNVAVHLRDGDTTIIDRLATLDMRPCISIVTRVELEGGIHAKPLLANKRRDALKAMLDRLVILNFEGTTADAYRAIVAQTGYSRPRILDRMIAATALVHGLTLITINGDDFRDIPGLSLEIWPSPEPQ